jgi:hypothetical protein
MITIIRCSSFLLLVVLSTNLRADLLGYGPNPHLLGELTPSERSYGSASGSNGGCCVGSGFASGFRHGCLWDNYCSEQQFCGSYYCTDGHWSPLRDLWRSVHWTIFPLRDGACVDSTALTVSKDDATRSFGGWLNRCHHKLHSATVHLRPQTGSLQKWLPFNVTSEEPTANSTSSSVDSPATAGTRSVFSDVPPILLTPADRPVGSTPAASENRPNVDELHQRVEPGQSTLRDMEGPEPPEIPQNTLPPAASGGEPLRSTRAVPARGTRTRLSDFIGTD